MKKKLIIANWKLNGNIKTISNFLKNLKLSGLNFSKENLVVIAPPAIYLEHVYSSISDTNILLGAQNVDVNLEGAFTGETSVLMLKDIGVKYIIIGHSERRFFHYETNKTIAKKFHLIKKLNLVPVLCIGETKEEKKCNKTKEALKKQLICVFDALGKTAFRNAVIAYEPVWAIGSGLCADPKDVQLIHVFIKNYVKEYDPISAKNLIIQYGGSVNQLNAKNFLEQPDINGLLIGSASLNYEEFLKIIDISNNVF